MRRLLIVLFALFLVAAGATWYANRRGAPASSAIAEARGDDHGRAEGQRTAPHDSPARHRPTQVDASSTDPDAPDARAVVDTSAPLASDAIEGVLKAPARAPAEDVGVWVLATKEKMGPLSWDRAIADGRDGLHRVPVEDGRFVVHRSPRAPTQLWLDARWIALRHSKVVSGSPTVTLDAQLRSMVEVTLAPPVIDADAQALEGIPCVLEGRRTSGPNIHTDPDRVRFARTDANGVVVFGGVRDDLTWTFRATPERWSSVELGPFEVERGVATVLDARFASGARLSGVVIDADTGEPIADAVVEWGTPKRARPFGEVPRETTTDALGRFTLHGAAAGTGELRATKDGWLSTAPDPFEVADGDEFSGLELRLPRGGVLRGRIVQPNGEPAAGADVRADHRPTLLGGQSSDEPNAFGRMEGDAAADEDGHFEISGVFRGEYYVQVAWFPRPGQPLRAWTGPVPANGEALELVVEPPPGLGVRVTDASGAAVPDARVRADFVLGPDADHSWNDDVYATEAAGLESTDPDELGVYRLPSARKGWHEVRVEAEGYSQQDAPLLVENTNGATVDVTLVAGARIAGVVLDPDGAPVARALVYATRPAEDDRPYLSTPFHGENEPATTDGDGRFHFVDLPPGSYEVAVDHSMWMESATLGVELGVGEAREDLVISLRRGAEIHGVVTDATGAATAAVHVHLSAHALGRYENTVTDERGEFRFEGLTPGAYTLIARPPDRSGDAAPTPFLMQQVVELAEGDVAEVTLAPPPAADPVHVHGVVRRGGAPVSGGHLIFQPEGRGLALPTTAAVGEDGTYAVAVPFAGRALLTYTPDEGFAGARPSFLHVPAVRSWEHDVDVPSASIRGSVSFPGDLEPRPQVIELALVASATATAPTGFLRTARSDADLAFAFEGVPPGTYELRSLSDAYGHGRADEYAVAVVTDVRVGTDDVHVDLTVSRGRSARGRIVGQDGAPVAGVAIFARRADGRVLSHLSTDLTDANGRFRVAHLPLGEVTLEAHGGGLASPPVVLPSGAEAVELVAAPATRLVVRFEDAGGSPVPARLSVRDGRGLEQTGLLTFASMEASQRSGPDSTVVTVHDLAPGPHALMAVDAEGRRASLTIELGGAPEREVRLRFEED